MPGVPGKAGPAGPKGSTGDEELRPPSRTQGLSTETESQAEFLRECGIEFLQGFFFSKPLSEDSFLEYLSKMDDESVVSELNILKK